MIRLQRIATGLALALAVLGLGATLLVHHVGSQEAVTTSAD